MPDSSLKIVFLGTPGFAVPSLDVLVKNGYEIAGVVTAPDKPAGRGQKLRQSPVKQYAVEHDLKVLQPKSLKDPDFLKELKSLNADLQIIVAFRMLPEAVWNMPPEGTFNLHASLLPQYRGAAPINWAVINGEKETGVTTFFLEHEIDTGKVIFREKTPIALNDTAGTLHDRLMEMGSDLVLKTVKAIESGNCPLHDQNDLLPEGEVLKEAPKIFKKDCAIDWSLPLEAIHNHIRGLSPYPTAVTNLTASEGKKYSLKVFLSEMEPKEHNEPVGKIMPDGSALKVAVKGGFILLKEVQLAGKKRMPAEVFLRGFQLDGQWKVNV